MVENSSTPRICVVAVSPMTVQAFLVPHLRQLAISYEVTVVTNFNRSFSQSFKLEQVRLVQLPIARKPSVFRDLYSLFRLIGLFRKSKFSATVSVNPKAGLLVAMAGFLARVKVRVHWFTGQVWVGAGPISRFLMKSLDRLVVLLSTSVLADGRAQAAFMVEQGIARLGQIEVLREGSISGVDCSRFVPSEARRLSNRQAYGLDNNVFVVVFLGRLRRDKGVFELAEAFSRMAADSQSFLLFVGPDEENVTPSLRRILESASKRFAFVGGTNSPEDYLALGDLMCLPSHREGFGSSVIEASATGIPVLVSDIYGLRDSFLNGVTGYDFPARDIEALTRKLDWFLHHPQEREILGKNGREFVEAYFDQHQIVDALESFLRERIRRAT